jgi:hypothetical protein
MPRIFDTLFYMAYDTMIIGILIILLYTEWSQKNAALSKWDRKQIPRIYSFTSIQDNNKQSQSVVSNVPGEFVGRRSR